MYVVRGLYEGGMARHKKHEERLQVEDEDEDEEDCYERRKFDDSTGVTKYLVLPLFLRHTTTHKVTNLYRFSLRSTLQKEMI